MHILEWIISLAAPHACLGCETEGSLLCAECVGQLGVAPPSRCYRCRRLTNDNKVCNHCRHGSFLKSVWTRCAYEGVVIQLVHAIKYAKARDGCKIVAQQLAGVLPELTTEYVIVPIPTANMRRRQRGYDQAELIARELSRQLKLPYSPQLIRTGNSRQVGTTRGIRLKQLRGAYACSNPQKLIGKRILLVDDVVTSGATIEAAARALHSAGCRHISAVVFAQA